MLIYIPTHTETHAHTLTPVWQRNEYENGSDRALLKPEADSRRQNTHTRTHRKTQEKLKKTGNAQSSVTVMGMWSTFLLIRSPRKPNLQSAISSLSLSLGLSSAWMRWSCCACCRRGNGYVRLAGSCHWPQRSVVAAFIPLQQPGACEAHINIHSLWHLGW